MQLVVMEIQVQMIWLVFFLQATLIIKKLKSYKDKNLNEFDKSLNNVLKNLAKSVAADGEGASKFVIIKVEKCKNENDAKKICFSIANSPLVKTAIAGEDPNWGRIIMAIGKIKDKIKS